MADLYAAFSLTGKRFTHWLPDDQLTPHLIGISNGMRRPFTTRPFNPAKDQLTSLDRQALEEINVSLET
jgi:hypothetical protein